MNHPVFLILPVLLLVAVLVDQRQHRVPNVLSALVAIGGIAAQSWLAGTSGALHALAGMALGFGVLMVPYLLRSLGAGDVKLMAAAGAWLGPGATAAACLVTLIVGAGFGLAVLTYRYYRASASVDQLLASRFPYAAAIAIGVSVSFIAKENPWML